MGPNKFIQNVKEYLNLEDFEKKTKKKAVKSLLKKLRTKRKKIKNELKETKEKLKKKELNEELDIIALQIKKGKKILKDLLT